MTPTQIKSVGGVGVFNKKMYILYCMHKCILNE